jgi:hypothetical protein
VYEAVRTLHDADALEQVVRAMTLPDAPAMEKARGPVRHAGFV